jgi:hypothetical protein
MTAMEIFPAAAGRSVAGLLHDSSNMTPATQVARCKNRETLTNTGNF